MRPDFSLHHGGLTVSDMDRSIDFYKRVLGFEPDTEVTTSDGSLHIVHLKRGNDYLELFCPREPQPLPEFARDNGTDFRVIGTKHIAFSTAHPKEFHRFLEEQSVDSLSPVYENNPHYFYFFFRDPDGICIEIVSPRNPPID